MSSDFNFTVTYLSLQNSFENRVKGLLSKIFDQPIWFDSICLLNYDFFIWTLGALYVAEIAQPNIRGGLGNCLSFSVALGITMAMFLGAIFPWRIVSIVCCVPQVIGMFH